MSWPSNPAGGNPYGQPPAGYNPQAGYAGASAPPSYNPAYGTASAPPSNPGGYVQHGPPAGHPGGYGPPPTHAPGYSVPGGYGAQPPPGIDPTLWHWFQAVDLDKSGKITATELQQALVNGNWSTFNPETCRLMIGMFDRDRSGTIDIHEFASLWKYIQDWKACFDRFDTDRSGNINTSELQNAFTSFGYRLSPNFCNLCVRLFDRQSTRTMKFDDFIQCSVMLKSLTDQFRQRDVEQRGIVRLSYEEFLAMALGNGVL